MQSSMGDKIMSQKEKGGYKKIRSNIGGQSKERVLYSFWGNRDSKNMVFENFERLIRAFTRSDRD